ncbi:MAG TPA: hypothetical protein VN512_03705 [Clostridia bacterium]|nr:hypothetical protein [Clostridia bacterium]
MRVLWGEIKKIWEPKLLLAIAAVCTLFFLIARGDFRIGHDMTETRELNICILQNYGVQMDESEFKDFLKLRDVYIEKAEGHIREDPRFAAIGIFNYEDYWRMFVDGHIGAATKEQQEVQWLLLSEPCGYIQFYLQALGRIEEGYVALSSRLDIDLATAPNESVRTRIAAVRDTGEYLGAMDGYTLERHMRYFWVFAVLAIFAPLALVSPLVVNDRSRRVHLLQYASHQGRRTLKMQFTAVLLSALLVICFLTAIFLLLYIYRSGDFALWNAGLTSFEGGLITRVPITLGQYVLLSIALIDALALGASLLAFVLSRLSQNLVSLLLKLLPTYIAAIALWFFVSDRLLILSFQSGFENSNFEIVFCALMFCAGLAACCVTVKREKRADVAG